MAQFSVGKLLPNLKVSVGNENLASDSTDVNDSISIDCSKVEIVRPIVENLQNPKIYFNKDGGFTTGIDLIEQESSGILNKRAERFGLDPDEFKPSISSLYESMGIDVNNKDSAKMRHIRLDAIHVRGLEELNTDEVFNYFKDYGPASIEWINDSSCNVLWFDEASCARALLGLSKPLPKSFPIEFTETPKSTEDLQLSSLDLNDDKEKEEMDIDVPSSQESESLDIPVPPGLWRLGVPHSSAKTIVLRFATKDDKKLPGAEKRSKYYQKYGNPNYGGMKGLISSSRKHKTQSEATRRVVQKGSSSSQKSFSSQQSEISVPKIIKPKILRMRMYADDEELKVKKLRSKNHFNERKGSVHSRLGAKYTADDLCLLGANQNSRYSSFPRTYESSRHKSEDSAQDLRSKLQRSRNNSKQDGRWYGRKYDEERVSDIKRFRRLDDLKKESRSFYKRKHRSPLCEDDDDDDDMSSDD